MSSETIDRDYLMRRCEQHLVRASRASDDAARALHQRFAALYRARAEGRQLVHQD